MGMMIRHLTMHPLLFNFHFFILTRIFFFISLFILMQKNVEVVEMLPELLGNPSSKDTGFKLRLDLGFWRYSCSNHCSLNCQETSSSSGKGERINNQFETSGDNKLVWVWICWTSWSLLV